MPNGIVDSILDTSSPQPNGKQDGGCFIRPIAFDNVCMRSGSKWPMIGPRQSAYACANMLTLFSLVKAMTSA